MGSVDAEVAVGLSARVTDALRSFLAARRDELVAIGTELAPIGEQLTSFLLEGGKRLRPAFAYWGWRGAGGTDSDDAVYAVAALELVQASALIHDDLMDGSDTRRGQPSIHRRFERLHRESGWQGPPAAFGSAAAILLGDLCLTWADQMLFGSGLPTDALGRAKPVYDTMRTELMSGQYLDVLGQVRDHHSVAWSLRVARQKSARYTIERPLHLGGALAGASTGLLASYSGYGLPLGEAFQLRDDILGVFGDPLVTGKPAGDDLREGKRTVLIALTLERASTAQARVVLERLGDAGLDDAGVAVMREIIAETGALVETERMIAARAAEAVRAIEGAEVVGEARGALRDLAEAATSRTV
ncbi:polyprenyl synthetase family protein [Fodinicola acaciae]|uniref:polyprenyl synthetase family protein n=1 Tax=Fodinicola acaciae TaxID=2681555 RepID=UPI001C9E39D5|nr:polyprenyl synthetase family protein [Fodinicola acaciae]